ncbi:MAG: ROK family protein [Planctomycetales bacterium]|nr:ROK family protein [Planctomycetales bacterium]
MLPLAEATPPFFAGIDVGGTNIKIGIVDDLGRTCAYRHVPTMEPRGPQDAMERAAATLREMSKEIGMRDEDCVAAGLATPGTMDIAKGILLQPHNLPTWWGYNVRDSLQAACGRPVSFANDANAAAFGEYWVGSGSEFHSMVLFTLGTGVGGGTIIGDLSVDGENSAGSEFGHTIIDYKESARMCGCGQRGHLEAYASAKAVVLRALEELTADPSSRLHERLQKDGDLTALSIAQEAEAGDPLAHHIVMDTAKYLGIGAVNVMHIVDPGAVIFGGAMNFGGHDSALGREFLNRIRQEICHRAFPVLAEKTHIDFARLGSDAGFIGAAGIARTQYKRKG